MRALGSRWVQLAVMVLCTVALSNMQYGWTLFVNPMRDETRWATASIQYAFSILIFLNTWLAPAEGWVADRWGPRFVVMVGGLAAGASWMLNARAHSLEALYGAAAVGGLGMGCVFGTCMGSALKLFPERRGMASGMIAAGYGLGSALTVLPISSMIAVSGYRHTFFVFGLLQGGSIVVLGSLLARPAAKPAHVVVSRGRECTPWQTLRSPVFWLIYAIYLMIAFGGMTVTAQLGPIARDFGVGKLLTFVVSIDNLANGLTRPFSGYLSDRIGRENAMLLMFSAEGAAFLGMATWGRNPLAFVICAAAIFLFWGEIFSLFPAICGDAFGVQNATANNGLLYTAKGTSALVVPLANYLVSATGGWTAPLLVMAVSSIASGVLAKSVLAPMRKRLAG
ncbi:MAG TPA: oxalate/formate MFS antiporter [Bryobacteraceae bacterium]|nr:oxalate/formate MFS antiporter [Bryobacteraceae bacterium]